MSTRWTGAHDARLFLAKLDEMNEAQKARLAEASRRQAPALLRRYEAFESFMDAIEAVSTSADPLRILEPVAPGGPGGSTDIYLLCVSPWCAYYYADPVRRVYVGLVVCSENASMEEVNGLIREALEHDR